MHVYKKSSPFTADSTKSLSKYKTRAMSYNLLDSRYFLYVFNIHVIIWPFFASSPRAAVTHQHMAIRQLSHAGLKYTPSPSTFEYSNDVIIYFFKCKMA